MDNPTLGGQELRDKIFSGLKVYEGKAFIERFGLFMGKAQLLEFGLKKILASLPGYNLSEEKLERLTLGQTRVELEKLGLRTDYNECLKSFKDKRNSMAHEFLANYAITQQLLDGPVLIGPFERELTHASYELEQLIIVFDFINSNGDVTAWLEPKAL
ncbi:MULTISPECIES: hypothetical protein [Klebsiella pneumoniae complex]|uniref:RiboL-PSP-HEPN domain-containing protein n=3 Tax=Klebsiella pneumoniae complex TaxID=3390273 RepID=A0A486TRE2_KLEPN|nr:MULTISPECIES: hypothetical protein [Klebsiella]DAT62760.1 MAG TPA: hypothetical protein [Caudoviricetes sp.]HDT5692519.1 hypothetical protein [Klebsiella quasipneumoniae subsp. similipneumoniae]APB53003.1 hypothetical protein AGE75_24395 [Klebsiella pneumoniae]ARZ95321.1 hypothetical protein AM373_22250 [Klebsiella pneumoniae]EIV7191139.1 hypothetical protein [Klebsiella pneumoniae]